MINHLDVDESPLQLPGRAVRYYSIARYALLEALRLAGVRQGSRVLMPAYVCRDLLAPLAILGATPVWYGLAPDLTPLTESVNWPAADAVLAVNYFGFAQPLAPFADYMARTGAVLIEDNAHGYLSRDEAGLWLGTRAGLGLFSLRKTLRIPDGAALVVKTNDPAVLPPQMPMNGNGYQPAQLTKARLRQFPGLGEPLYRTATGLARVLRKWRSGSAIPPPDPESERRLPTGASPWQGLQQALADCQIHQEVARRRAAYVRCAEAGARAGVQPVFAQLPDGCAPYGYPFRAAGQPLLAMQRFAEREGFDCVSWPDLPGAIAQDAPDYYRNVFLINFLW